MNKNIEILPPQPRIDSTPTNREEKRRAVSLKKRCRLARNPGHGYGKHAMNGKKYRFVHVNWTVRICEEMRQSRRVLDFSMREYLKKHEQK